MRSFGERCRARSGSAVWVALLLCLWTIPESAVAEPRSTSLAKIALEDRDVDFNGDGYADLAVGEILAVVDGELKGAVHVMYGSAGGLRSNGSQYWTENTLGGAAHRWDVFGASLASGDFDGDDFSDLAIGLPQAELDPPFGDEGSDHGLVRIVYGSSTGLTPARTQLWSHGRMTGGADRGAQFGGALAAGNFGRGDQDDLAISGAGEEKVAVLFGGTAGLAAAGHQIWSQNSAGIAGTTSSGDGFGAALVAGNFTGGGYADLAIGIPGDRVGAVREAGAVQIISGAAAGLTAAGSQVWSQNSAGIAGRSERGDGFGTTLAAGRLDGGAYDALAIGVPLERVGKHINAGAVNVIYGSPAGLRAAGDQVWSQSSRGIRPRSEEGDEFGSALAIGNFGRDVDGRSYADLAVGAYGESVGRVGQAGSVTVLYGAADGLRSADSQGLTQRSAGVPGSPEEQDYFGGALAAADFGHRRSASGFDDLALSVGGEVVGNGYDPNGAVTVVYGGARGLDTRSCQFWSALKLGHPTSPDGGAFGDAIDA